MALNDKWENKGSLILKTNTNEMIINPTSRFFYSATSFWFLLLRTPLVFCSPGLGTRGAKTISSCQVTVGSLVRLSLKRRQGYQAGFQRSCFKVDVYVAC